MAEHTVVKHGSHVDLDDYDPGFHGDYKHHHDTEVQEKLDADIEAMAGLQERLYAEGKQALLVVLQGMDAGGKDGTVKHVMRGLNPQSCSVTSFKQPTAEELAHDYLWRIHKRVPAHGQIVVFNRSHYEDVLVVRVHNLVPEQVWEKRYDEINAFEERLVRSGTRIVKFFLHISRDEQKKRLEERLDDPEKHWKFNPQDLAERRLWPKYKKAYEEALSRCSTEHAPWHVVPANHKWYRNLVVADVLVRVLREMDPQYPEPQMDVSKIKID